MRLELVCRMMRRRGWTRRVVLLSSSPQQMGQAPLGALRSCGAPHFCSSIAFTVAVSAEKQHAEGNNAGFAVFPCHARSCLQGTA